MLVRRSLPASAALRAYLAPAQPLLDTATARLWRDDGLRERYPDYLRAMHGVLRASVPLLREAARRCRDAFPGSSTHRLLAPYLDRHIDEELGHDEWLLADLAALGVAADALAHRPPGPAVARLVGPQYYWLLHHDPVCLLGYLVVMEGNAPAPTLAAALRQRTGLPAAAFRTLHHHAALDPSHTRDLDALIDRLPLTQAQAGALRLSALTTLLALTDLLNEVAEPPVRKEPDHDRAR